MPTHRTRISAVVQARLPLPLVQQLEALAARQACTVSDLVRRALTRLLASDTVADSVADVRPTEAVALSDALRVAIDQYIAQAVQEAVHARLAPVGHVPASLDPPPVRRARRDVPPPDRPSDGSYDATRFYLATLCKRGHDWQGTGQSLLRRQNNNCVQCQRELRRAREARKI